MKIMNTHTVVAAVPAASIILAGNAKADGTGQSRISS